MDTKNKSWDVLLDLAGEFVPVYRYAEDDYKGKWAEALDECCPTCRRLIGCDPCPVCDRDDDPRDYVCTTVWVMMYGSLFSCALCGQAFQDSNNDPNDLYEIPLLQRYLYPTCR